MKKLRHGWEYCHMSRVLFNHEKKQQHCPRTYPIILLGKIWRVLWYYCFIKVSSWHKTKVLSYTSFLWSKQNVECPAKNQCVNQLHRQIKSPFDRLVVFTSSHFYHDGKKEVETWRSDNCDDPSYPFFSACPSLSEAVYFLFPLVSVSSFKTQFLPFCYTLLWLTSSRDRKERAGESFLHREDCLSWPITCCNISSVCVCVCVCLCPNLFLQVRLSEGEQELLDVLGAQAVDAARVDGPAQELVHLVLWV